MVKDLITEEVTGKKSKNEEYTTSILQYILIVD